MKRTCIKAIVATIFMLTATLSAVAQTYTFVAFSDIEELKGVPFYVYVDVPKRVVEFGTVLNSGIEKIAEFKYTTYYTGDGGAMFMEKGNLGRIPSSSLDAEDLMNREYGSFVGIGRETLLIYIDDYGVQLTPTSTAKQNIQNMYDYLTTH